MLALINNFLTLSKVVLDILEGGDGSLHPWVSLDLIDGESLAWVFGHELLKKILKLAGVDIFSILGLGVSLPENLSLLLSLADKLVVDIIWMGRCKWWSLSKYDKKNDCGGEEID